jgi:hypothetical protein
MTTDAWNLMQHWDLVLPPSRPSATQLARIKSQIRDLDRSRPVAILGSTPEFRDLLFECGFQEIYVLEKHLRFLAAMSALRVYKNTERVIEGDWLTTLPTLKGKFALILSDLTSGNIPYNIRSQFYGLITRALTEGGLFCDKVLTHPGQHIPLSSLVEKYAELPLNLHYVNHFSCEALFCSELLDIERTVNSSLFYSILDERIQNERVRAFTKHAQKITPLGFVWWYGRKWEEVADSYCRELETIALHEDEPSSPYYGRLKMFLHVKR